MLREMSKVFRFGDSLFQISLGSLNAYVFDKHMFPSIIECNTATFLHISMMGLIFHLGLSRLSSLSKIVQRRRLFKFRPLWIQGLLCALVGLVLWPVREGHGGSSIPPIHLTVGL